MAVSPDPLIVQCWRGLMRVWSSERAVVSVDKNTLLEAFRTTDAWIDQIAASFNTSLPVAARSGLTAGQKTILFCIVALARAGGVQFLRRLLGEVD